ncbi:MAG TPA: hypothetical protein VLD84_02055 [Nitrososphaeraceae archaeon]|nr:hypothetical protein [Nitrososphaeraceae archaeon]
MQTWQSSQLRQIDLYDFGASTGIIIGLEKKSNLRRTDDAGYPVFTSV